MNKKPLTSIIHRNWRDKFKEEFGIHFSSKDELDFAIEFIREEKMKSYNKGKKFNE